MEKNEKYKAAFKQSKAKVKAWEGEFYEKYQRKPSKKEIKTAPEQIKICYKNCFKIKSYFDSQTKTENVSKMFDEDSQTMDITTAAQTKTENVSKMFDEDSQTMDINTSALISVRQTSFSGLLSNTTTILPPEKNEKYKTVFKQSKAKVKAWEGEFYEKYQRKPSKKEIKTAPEQIKICYKNCFKIKSYFDS
eukprot:GFUD01025977.1.p1 GENE.GFUD01025977.1~~GFUD01025977.1.p1  ORF type:complete len:209 (-),score=62.01 GFUD01025977.1:68-643(-)